MPHGRVTERKEEKKLDERKKRAGFSDCIFSGRRPETGAQGRLWDAQLSSNELKRKLENPK